MPASLAGIDLPESLQWADEFATWALASQKEVTLGGALLIEESEQLAGRPITLQSGQNGSQYWGMATRAQVELLHALANTKRDTAMLLELDDGRTFRVRWNSAGLEAKPWKHVWPADAADLYSITLRLLEAPDPV